MFALILEALTLALKAAPTVVTIVKNSSGGATVFVYLDQADAQTDANLKQINDWMISHGKAPVA